MKDAPLLERAKRWVSEEKGDPAASQREMEAYSLIQELLDQVRTLETDNEILEVDLNDARYNK